MATTFKWTAPESIATYMTTALDGLANATFAGVGAAIDNETDLYPYIAFEVNLASLDPTAGAFVDIWINASLDGTNYATPTKPLITSNLLCTIQLDDASAAQRLVKGNILIPPLKFKLDLRNMSGVALNASGNTLKYRRYFDQGV